MRALTSLSGVGVRFGLLGGLLAAAGVSIAVYLAPGSALVPAAAQDVTYFRIGAGTPGSNYYAIAGRIAAIVSNPPGSRACDGDSACGVEGLLGLAQTTANPVAGLESLRERSLDAALVSADVADMALHGKGPFKESGQAEELRAIANVGELMLQVLVPAASKATDLKGLTGTKIAIGAKDSDGAITARYLLRAGGLSDKKAKLVTDGLETIAEDLEAGKVDALAVVDRLPSPEVAELMTTGAYRLLPVEIAGENKPDYVFSNRISEKEYGGAEATSSIGVPVVLVVRSDLPGQIAGGLLRALWHAAMPEGGSVRPGLIAPNMSRASIPWHPRAAEAFQQLTHTEPATPPTTPPTN